MRFTPVKAALFSTAMFAAVFVLAATSKTHVATDKVKVTAVYYRLKTAIDVMKVKAIGTAQSKASPAALMVTNAEAARIEGVVEKAGGVKVGSPTILTPMGQMAKISADGDDGYGYALQVTPSSKGSDEITLNFKFSITWPQGAGKVTRSGSGITRNQEAKTTLLIVNPRAGQPGMLVVITAKRVK